MEKFGFQVHLGVYIVANIIFVVMLFITSYPFRIFPRFVIPSVGWGIGVGAHFIGVYLGEYYAESCVDKEYERLKRKQKAS